MTPNSNSSIKGRPKAVFVSVRPAPSPTLSASGNKRWRDVEHSCESIRGSLGSVVRTRFWRFRAQTGPASPILEFDMTADARREDWRLRRVTTIDGY
jgi:hypothetical protein